MREHIHKYLDKRYSLGLIGYKVNGVPDDYEYGNQIVQSLTRIFSIDAITAYDMFCSWAIKFGLPKNVFDNFYLKKELSVRWSPELAHDVHWCGMADEETELITRLSEQIANEIDAQILVDYAGQLNNDNFLSIMKCLGYQTGMTIYDPDSFEPSKKFIPTSITEMRDEQQSNTIWQNWVRAREQNQEA